MRHFRGASSSHYIQKTVTNINQLMKTVKVVEDDSQKATRALESALESIGQDLQTLYSDTTASRQSAASPEDLLKINRALAEATGKAVAASNSKKQEDVVSVANTGRKVISDLLNTIKVGVHLIMLPFWQLM